MAEPYNLSQLRILWEIASDGLVFNNILSHSELATGDFGPTNIKTDIIEQKWRTTDTSNAFIIFDVGMTFDQIGKPSKAITVDTIALLGTNLSTKAEVKIYAYGQAFEPGIYGSYQGSIPDALTQFYLLSEKTIVMERNDDPYEENVLWVSPTETIDKYRHWCIHISDPQNEDGYIEVGRFIAGSASILSGLENITSDVTYQEVSYKDEMKINGFSSISNNRAIKKKMTISFENIDMNGDNYKIIRRALRYIRDTKKALFIPDPTDVYRFNLFGKVSEMPKQKVRYIDEQCVYASFDVEIDEGR